MTEPAPSPSSPVRPMVRVRLEGPSQEPVAEVELLPFVRLPQVVLWGARVFIRADELELIERGNIYREADGVAVAIRTC